MTKAKVPRYERKVFVPNAFSGTLFNNESSVYIYENSVPTFKSQFREQDFDIKEKF